MRPTEDIRELIENLNDTTSADMDQQVLADVIKALDETKTTKSAANRPKIWRTIMRSPITRVAAAAVIVIAALIAMSRFGDSTGSVAWGEVVSNIEARPGFIYRMRQTHNNKETGTTDFNMMAYGSARYGLRLDGYSAEEVTIQTYASLRDEAITSIMHSSKAYTRMPLSGDQLAEIRRMDPKEAVREFLSAEYTKLGRRTIDGVEAEGVEITDPPTVSTNFPVDSCVVKLWVAMETDLPVLVEVDTVGKNGTLKVHTIQDNFQWNVELDASEFEPNIPEDYKLMEAETDGNGKVTITTTATKKEHSQLSVELKDNESESHLPGD